MSGDTPSSSSTTTSLFSFATKLIFFNRVRRFLQSKSARKRSAQPLIKPNNTIEPAGQPPSTSPQFETTSAEASELDTNDPVLMGSESEVLISGGDAVEVVMRRAVKELLFGKREQREKAITEVKRLAKEDMKVRKELAELGVVPALVEMVVDSEVADKRRSAIQALIELADGTFT